MVSEKKIKRTRKKKDEDSVKKPQDKLYFNDDTQAAIVAYQKSIIPKERNQIYVETVLPSFEKLAENLINIHKFAGVHDSYEDLKSDCVNFLFEKISKFDAEKGTNAFSYFNVVAKNWLIMKTKQKTLKSKRSFSLSEPSSFTKADNLAIEEYNYVQSSEDQIIDFENKIENIEILYSIRNKIKNPNELNCINAIITIFENIDNLDLTNKSAIFFYIKEISGLTPKQLSTSMQTLKKYFKKFKRSNE